MPLEWPVQMAPHSGPFVIAGPELPACIRGVKQYSDECPEPTSNCTPRPTIRISLEYENMSTHKTLGYLGSTNHINIERLSSGVPQPFSPPDLYSACAVCEDYATLRCARCHAVRYCSKVCQRRHWLTPGEGGHRARCLPIHNFKHLFVVKPSVISGIGVFASQDIPKGTRIALFDYNVKKWHMHACVRFSTITNKIHILTDSYFKSFVKPNPEFDHSMYLYPDLDLMNSTSVATGYVLIGRPYHTNPSPQTDPLAAGHLINDGAEPQFDSNPNKVVVNKIGQVMEQYKEFSKTFKNVDIDEEFWFYATRNIAKGEELLTTYGEEFWLHRQLLKATDPRARLLIFAVMCFYTTKSGSNWPYDPFRCVEYDTQTNMNFLMDLCGYTEKEILENKTTTLNSTTPEDFICSILSSISVEFNQKEMKAIERGIAKDFEETLAQATSMTRFAAAKMRKQKKDEKRKNSK